MRRALTILILTSLLLPAPTPAADVFNRVRDGYADDAGVSMVPGAGHFIQQDAWVLVTRTIKRWLAEERRPQAAQRTPGG